MKMTTGRVVKIRIKGQLKHSLKDRRDLYLCRAAASSAKKPRYIIATEDQCRQMIDVGFDLLGIAVSFDGSVWSHGKIIGKTCDIERLCE